MKAEISGRFVCPVCQTKRFSSLPDKKEHMRTEHGPKPVKAER